MLFQFFSKKFVTCRVFEMHKHCRLPQSRRRFVISSHKLDLSVTEKAPMTVRELLGDELKWNKATKYWTMNSFLSVRDVDRPIYTITSGNLWVGTNKDIDRDTNKNIDRDTLLRIDHQKAHICCCVRERSAQPYFRKFRSTFFFKKKLSIGIY